MKAIFLLILGLCATSNSYAGICYEGEFKIPVGRASAHYYFKLEAQDATSDAYFSTAVLNPDDIVVTDIGQKKISDYFRSDYLKLKAFEGVRCPCLAYRSEGGSTMFIIESLGDKTIRPDLTYYNTRPEGTLIAPCKQ